MRAEGRVADGPAGRQTDRQTDRKEGRRTVEGELRLGRERYGRTTSCDLVRGRRRRRSRSNEIARKDARVGEDAKILFFL